MPDKQEKEQYMRRALELSVKARGYTAPNPMVGCVVVKDGEVISEGYHERCGEYHAERNALLRCTKDCTGADLYVTLEPCCHHGKTPPCTDIIIEKKIGTVYVGAMDSNPRVAGKGVKLLEEAGIKVETGILEEACRAVNEVFFHYMERKRPFVAMKYAMTLDGKIACGNGDSKWVTGERARAYVQQLRKYYTGIMVGIGTVLADDPLLTCRVAPECNPVRIVADSRLRIPLDCQLVQTAADVPTIVACSETACGQNSDKKRELELAGVTVVVTKGEHVDLNELLDDLAQREVDSILLEGGGTLNAAMLQKGLVDRVYAFVAPKLVGGSRAKTPISGEGVSQMADAWQLTDMTYQTFDSDWMLTGRVQNEAHAAVERR